MTRLFCTLTISTLLPLALAGCSGKSSSGGGKKSGPQHWAERPTETLSAKHGGIAFTIDVPKGMRQKNDKTMGFELDFLIDGYVKMPSISVRASGKLETLEEYLKGESNKDFIRKEQLPDGFITSGKNSAYKGKEDYIVYVAKKAGDKSLICHARVSHWARGDKVKKYLPKLEKICLSLKAK